MLSNSSLNTGLNYFEMFKLHENMLYERTDTEKKEKKGGGVF